MSEEAIQATAVDAISCKIYAVKHGYYEDDALLKLLSRGTDTERKSPEIARGTWARVQGTRQELRRFYEKNASRRKVVINCGAGFDTTFWWAKSEGLFKDGEDLWFDLDMEAVVRQRIRRLRMPAAKSLVSSLQNLKITDSKLASDAYQIRVLDMKRSEESAKLIEEIKEEYQIDDQTDVCLIFECVLVYMPTETSGRFLKAAADDFENLKVISYEQLNLNDRFGTVMLENLVQRGCGLDGIDACLSKATQIQRFERVGFRHVDSLRHHNSGEIER
ncbi:Oidioi.mRNA.OKI2018_I69.PAR.g10375.t1.cds [Oikopleura dioica]|uniref:Leucine carboxyl methyltransferase 1 n=1 Tax=Oikopleura dioica TaxID=34765 RepID=A0ABN7RQ96_OIKDI|nr:Oidioi.mRNA.OKI2018_I69.PAR.g10375.t1.cds [Oikopleura dioica]